MDDNQINRFQQARPKAGLTLALIWAYISAVFLVGEPGVPIAIGFWRWLFFIVIALLAGNFLAAWAMRRQVLSGTQLANMCLFGSMLTICLLALDIAYSMYLNSTVSGADAMQSRVFDENVWVSELYPKVYYPNERNFALHKPNVAVSGSPYGNFYSEPMQSSPTLVGSVLEKTPISIHINALGFRESTNLSAGEIFTLGDSFTFGWGVNASDSWVGLLERQLDKPIYNLGIHDSSPKQELELLKYVLQEQGENIHVGQLLWMIYEGNDLEDDYSEEVQRYDPSVKRPLIQGTLIDAAEKLMWTIKRQSVINRLRHGQITWKQPVDGKSAGPYSVDGVTLVHPLYYSPELGPRLFYQSYVDLAGEPASYVENHWNREALEGVFRDMELLADEYDFEVAVIMAPSASRLHGPYFENFPEISEKPHFIDFLAELSDSAGFQTVNLYELMKPYANSELLYFRDDDHFNHRGNALAAELIQRKLFTDRD
jgi:hypothetical protein